MKPSPDLRVPRHIAIIMDGNGRWAKRGGLIRLRGHEAGIDSVRDVTTAAAQWGVQHLTLYAFSIENWQRPPREVRGLMNYLQKFLREELPTLLENGVRLRGLGRLHDLPDDVQRVLREVEAATAHCDRMVLRLALSYGGRQEIVDAIRRIAARVQAGEMSADDVTVASLGEWLYHADMPDPDLIIRSAGELRLSNFLLWQSSYSEFWFTETVWPEFRRKHLLQAIQDYGHRVRRYGRVIEDDPAVRSSS